MLIANATAVIVRKSVNFRITKLKNHLTVKILGRALVLQGTRLSGSQGGANPVNP